MFRKLIPFLSAWLIGCGSSPTSPTPPAVVVPPPVVYTVTATNGGQVLEGLTVTRQGIYTHISGPGIVPRVARSLSTSLDAIALEGFDLEFYRDFARGGLLPGAILRPIQRWTQAPAIYIKTIDDMGVSVPTTILEMATAAIINTTSAWTGGAFGVAHVERGVESRAGLAGWIDVSWSTAGVCGSTFDSGREGARIVMNVRRSECTCGPLVTKHELGHALGFSHTDSQGDLMAATFAGVCDKDLSPRERAHAAIVYKRPNLNLDPDQDQ